MKILCVVTVLITSVTVLHAGDPEGFSAWKATAIQNSGKELAGKMDNQKFAWQPLGNYENHLIGISHRESDGSAEVHETQVDIWIVESGEATLVLGGTVIDPKTVKPHEIRGKSIEGGTKWQLTAGDIVHIPVNVPHQLKIADGKTFTYTVIKVDSK
jgi:mannose-6-phosphate isomerase-like protein (cupin superfamily)